ncbi:MAG: sugar ABC transporter permease [Treponema sp.]|jgi:sn-glycerol 3-phosphate transport system permease protein|nr:sugar ABC transporter permease [Treponema sp.]
MAQGASKVPLNSGGHVFHVSERNRKWKRTLSAWILLLPALVFLSVFTLYPIANSLFGSFFKNDLAVIKPRFTGLDNYTKLLSDSIFLRAFRNNLLTAAVTIPLSIAIAVAAAVFVNGMLRGKSFFRISFFYPVIMPMVAVANIWLFIYTPAYGLLGRLNPSWHILGNPDTVLWGIVAMLVWKQAGYLMIFYLSGLQGISRELYEAARIDGSGPVCAFFKITWPLLRPVTVYATILSLTNAYKMVDHLYIMTKGGPNNASNMLLFYTFQTGFEFWDVGYAGAMTLVLVLLLLIITGAQFFTQDARYEK